METAKPAPRFICYNGDIIPSGAIFDPSNRSFLYGDGLFETMRSRGGYVPLLSQHLTRLRQGMRLLGLNEWSFPFDTVIEQAISRLLHRNKYLKAARLRLTVFRKSGGYYAPESDEIEYLITATPLDTGKFELNSRGLIVDIYTDIPVVPSPLTQIKTSSAMRLVLAAQWAKSRKLDDCLLVNQQGNLVESTSSNLFILHGDTVYTPPLSDGCLPGIMRAIIINLCRDMGKNVVENKSINPTLLKDATEVFLTNAVHGVRWVLAYGDYGYYHRFSANLVEKLNQHLELNR